MPAETVGAVAIIDILQSAGTLGLLVLIAVLFYRGEILSRRVWEHMIKEVVEGICIRYEATTNKMVAEVVAQIAQCSSCAHFREHAEKGDKK